MAGSHLPPSLRRRAGACTARADERNQEEGTEGRSEPASDTATRTASATRLRKATRGQGEPEGPAETGPVAARKNTASNRIRAAIETKLANAEKTAKSAKTWAGTAQPRPAGPRPKESAPGRSAGQQQRRKRSPGAGCRRRSGAKRLRRANGKGRGRRGKLARSSITMRGHIDVHGRDIGQAVVAGRPAVRRDKTGARSEGPLTCGLLVRDKLRQRG